MSTPVYLGLSIDESFGEFSLLQLDAKSQPQRIAQQRVFLPRESIKTSLKKFLETFRAEHALPIEKAAVSLRFLEKIFDYRLGGSVAQLVTAGFENWLQIRSIDPCTRSLSNPDLIFPVNERISAGGAILQGLNSEELEAISEKLKAADVKRVCLHFLHSQIQNAHVEMARKFFLEKGFDVFVPLNSDNDDEISRWRANTLNASLSGTFLELQEEVNQACAEFLEPKQIYYLSADQKTFQGENNQRLGNLFSTRAALLQLSEDPSDMLYLGLEKFSWLRKSNTQFWQSPWGNVALPHPVCEDLEIQPTSAIGLNDFNELDFSDKVEGYEPGPMSLGRGQKPCFLDLFAEDPSLQKIAGLSDRLSAAGGQKFKNALIALAKGSASKNADAATLIKELKTLAVQRISIEVSLHSSQVRVVGPLVELLGPLLKQQNKTWKFDGESFGDSRAVAEAGAKWQVIQ